VPSRRLAEVQMLNIIATIWVFSGGSDPVVQDFIDPPDDEPSIVDCRLADLKLGPQFGEILDADGNLLSHHAYEIYYLH